MDIRRILLVAGMALGLGCGYGPSHRSGSSESLTGNGAGGAGNITFAWSFEGKSCSQAAVQTVAVSMPGQFLENDGQYPCTTASRDGITLSDFAAGTYPFTVSGYDAQGVLRYQVTGAVVTDGTDQLESLDLLPTDNQAPGNGGVDAGTAGCGSDAGMDAGSDGGEVFPPGGTVGGNTDGGTPSDAGVQGGGVDAGVLDAGSTPDGGPVQDGGTCGCGHSDGGVDAGTYLSYVSWTFPAVANAPTCGDELSQVVLTIDGQAVVHECGAGLFPSRVALPSSLSPGQHALEIDAIDATGRPWASTQVSIDIPSGSSSYQTYPVPWVVGSAAIDWTFFNCDGSQTYATCALAGVDTVAINFQDALGRWLYADAHGYPMDDLFGCSTANGSAVIRAVTPGAYTVFAAGYGPRDSGILYDEYPDQAAYPISVKAGVFFTSSSPVSDFVSVDLYQQ